MTTAIERIPQAIAEASDTLENLLTGMGGPNDSRAQGIRSFDFKRRTPQDLISTYRSHWMAAKMVEIPAFEMTRAQRKFSLNDPEKVKLLEAEAERVQMWERTREAIQWSRLLGGGAILLGLDGTGEMDEPLDINRVKQGSLQFIHTLDSHTIIPWGAENTLLINNPTSPQFMRPEFYTIASANMEFVHHTRIIRFPGVPLPWLEMIETLWWGDSHISRSFDAVADAESVIGGIAGLINEAKVDVFGIKNLMQMLSTPGGTEKVIQRVQVASRMKSQYNALILDEAEKYDQKTNSIVQGMAGLIEQYLVICAAASDIPVTRLIGTSAKGLDATGEGDLRNFYDMIDAQRTNYLRPRLCEFDEVFVRSALGEIPEDYSWEFGSLWQMDEGQVAEIESKRSARDEIYLNAGVVTESIVAKQLQIDGTYDAIDDDYIADLEALENDPEPEPDPIPPAPVPDPDPTKTPDPAPDPVPGE